MRFFTGVPSAAKKRDGRPNGLGAAAGTLATSFREMAADCAASSVRSESEAAKLSATTALSA